MKLSKHHIVFVIVLLIFCINFYFFRTSSYFTYSNIVILLTYLVVLYVGVTRYRLNYFCEAITKGKHEGIALTFDDGPNAEYTEKLLKILKEKEVKASFFVIGKNVEQNPKILKKIVAEGHIVGNHSYSHVTWFNTLLPSMIKKDIKKAENLIIEIIGKKPRFFRAPFGLTSPHIYWALRSTKYLSIAWDFRSFDTMAKTKTELLKKMKLNAAKCSIMLMHDNNEITLSVLPEFIDYCKENGINIVSLDKMIAENAYIN